MKCHTCKFFKHNQSDSGECRRHPPQGMLLGSQNALTRQTQTSSVGFWPPVNADHWCGDYEAKLSTN